MIKNKTKQKKILYLPSFKRGPLPPPTQRESEASGRGVCSRVEWKGFQSKKETFFTNTYSQHPQRRRIKTNKTDKLTHTHTHTHMRPEQDER